MNDGIALTGNTGIVHSLYNRLIIDMKLDPSTSLKLCFVEHGERGAQGQP